MDSQSGTDGEFYLFDFFVISCCFLSIFKNIRVIVLGLDCDICVWVASCVACWSEESYEFHTFIASYSKFGKCWNKA